MVLQRHEINEKDTWDLSTIYPTDQAWEEALKDLTEKVQTASQYEGHLWMVQTVCLRLQNSHLTWNAKLKALCLCAYEK